MSMSILLECSIILNFNMVGVVGDDHVEVI